MHAIHVDRPGGPEVLRWGPAADPEPRPGEVLIEVEAAGVNNADLLQRAGGYPVPPGASQILGLECAGRVAALGTGVSGFAVGEPVCALLAGGGYAEFVAVPAGQVLPVPPGLDAVGAAALPEAACTVHSNLAAHVRKGSTLLVHGGGSGIGTFAVQWGVARGARVLTTAGSARKVNAAIALGADVGIDYAQQEFVEAVLDATGGRGVDVVLDLVGAPYLLRNLDALADDGVIVLLGGDLSPTEVPLGRMLRKRATITATALRSRPLEQKAEIVAAVRAEVWPAVAEGRIRPVVDRVVPMADAAEAHRALASGGTIGKVVLAV
jgi:putative PIG3 family NAD(P)H quinone oxidoreductase